MKKLLTVVVMLTAMGIVRAAETSPYFKAEAGLVGLGALSGTTIGVRGGTEWSGWDGSFGYTRDMCDLDSDKVQSNGATVHTLGVELYRRVVSLGAFVVGAGGGFGYSIVDLDGRDKAEADISYQAGSEAQYALGNNWIIGLSVKGFWLRSHVRRTDFGSHIETLSTGQDVEVVDEFHHADSLSFNSARLMLSATYRF